MEDSFADSFDSDVEYTLLNKRDVLVYQVPPSTSSSGHKADDWTKCIWRGRMRVVGKGKDMSIKLLDASSGNLFAQCAVPNGDHATYVERVTDSSRYFVLKITNGNRHAFIGLGFEDRNDAFDFNCCLSDFKTTFVDRDDGGKEAANLAEPMKDMSLKEGQKITVNLKGLEGRKKREPTPEVAAGAGLASLLAPPPASGSRRQQAQARSGGGIPGLGPPPGAGPAQAAPAAQSSAPPQDAFADFGDFESAGFQAAPTPAPMTPAAAAPAFAAPASKDPFGADFDSFGFDTPASAPTAVPAATPAAMPAAAPQVYSAPMAAAPSSDPFDPFAGISSAPSVSLPAARPSQSSAGDDPFDIFK